MNIYDKKNNLSIDSITGVTKQQIFEGFLFEDLFSNVSDNKKPIKFFGRHVSDKLSNNQRFCASWNSKNDFIHVISTPHPFRIYFDDIIAINKIESDSLQLIAYILRKKQRQKVVYKLCFYDFQNFERMFFVALKPKIPPNVPNIEQKRNNSTNSFNEVLRSLNYKLLVLINPFSGEKKALNLWMEHTQPIFDEAKISYYLIKTIKRGHATHIARNLNLNEFGAIVIVSGDGLVAEVIHGLLTHSTDRERALCLPLLHIPGGTGNGLAASVAFQSNEPFSARGVFCKEMTLMLASGRPRYRPLRLYCVETKKNGFLPMFMTLTWGLMADIDLGSERFRWAGMIRLHMEAFIRIARLSSVARYRGRISYLPVIDKKLLRKTRLIAHEDRSKFGDSHFDCQDVQSINFFNSTNNDKQINNLENDNYEEIDLSSSIKEAFKGTYLAEMPPLNEPVPSNWTVIESEFVFVCLSAMSHLGSDLPYMPCTKLEEEIFYLTFVDWRTLKSRLHMAQLLMTIDRCAHLSHQCFQTIPVMACRVEPDINAGGYVAIDGEPCKSGQAYQVVSTSLQATVVARQPRYNLNTK